MAFVNTTYATDVGMGVEGKVGPTGYTKPFLKVAPDGVMPQLYETPPEPGIEQDMLVETLIAPVATKPWLLIGGGVVAVGALAYILLK